MYVLGIDYGQKRVGLALASVVAKLPQPLKTVAADETLLDTIRQTVEQEQVSEIVVGIARNMDGTLGPQAARCREFGETVAEELQLPVHFVDETLSSVEAEAYVRLPAYAAAGLDAAAAACILDRYFEENQ